MKQAHRPSLALILTACVLSFSSLEGRLPFVQPAFGQDGASPMAVTTSVEPACDLSGLAFKLEVCNTGTIELTNVVTTDTLPIGLMFSDGSLAAVDPGGSPFGVALCEPIAGQTIQICFEAPIPPGECVTVTFVATFAEALCNHVVVTADGPPPSDADEGCTPGFWKNHFSDWEPTGYSPGDNFNTVFGVGAFDPDQTLENAVNQGGGEIKALGRHAVAALLNAADPDVNYALQTPEVIAIVQQAVAPGGDVGAAKDQLEALNELGCPLGGEASGPATVTASDTTCLDTLLSGAMACVCGPSDPGGDAFDIPAFCGLAPDECDPSVIEFCIFEFSLFIFDKIEEAKGLFFDERCPACCPPDEEIFCQCLSP